MVGILNLTQANFDEVIQNNDCVIVDFWAKWCSPCVSFSETFEEVSKLHPDVIFAKVDIEAEKVLADDFQIRSVPYIMVFRREFAVYAQSGTLTKQHMDTLIQDAKAINVQALRQQLKESSDHKDVDSI